MIKYDMTGNTYNDLTVVEMLPNFYKNGKSYCKCICKCGKECIKDFYEVRVGKAKRCPTCSKIMQNKKTMKDWVGKRFGRLFVLEVVSYSPTKVKCLCDCGNYTIVNPAQLSYGKTQSCGCLQKEMASKKNTKIRSGFVNINGIQLLKQAYKNNHGTWMWECKCGYCGNNFYALPAKVISNVVVSCGCHSRSNYELFIAKTLRRFCIEFEEQKKFPDCKYINNLKFDFYLPMYNAVIEYNGRQHYEEVSYFGGKDGLEKTQIRDAIKEQYCKDNDIKFLCIPYTMDFKQIESILQILYYPRDCNT